jgi:O-antigen ligase
MFQKLNLDYIYKYLLISLAFLMPLTVSGANTIIALIVLIWLLSGNYKEKFSHIMSSKLMIASIVFYCLHVLGMLWTEDIAWGFEVLHKMWYFILLWPVLFNIVNKSDVKYFILAFFLAISITEIISYLIWFEVIPPFKNASVSNPTPFMSHISYNPILAFALYLLGHEVLFSLKINKYRRYCYSFFLLTMSVNMFITGGRAGQIMYFVVVSLLIFQYFRSQIFKGFFVSCIVVSSIFFSAYQTSDIFNTRVNDAIENIKSYESNKNTPVGQRITWAVNSWEVIMDNPLIGIGTGDFPKEYLKVNKKNTPQVVITRNPHNMYILILMQLGFIGLVSFILIFYYQIVYSFKSHNKFYRDVGLAIPLLFLLIMFSESYLLGHYTSLVYVFFSSFLYKDFEKS